jgi:hypothetical protein
MELWTFEPRQRASAVAAPSRGECRCCRRRPRARRARSERTGLLVRRAGRGSHGARRAPATRAPRPRGRDRPCATRPCLACEASTPARGSKAAALGQWDPNIAVGLPLHEARLHRRHVLVSARRGQTQPSPCPRAAWRPAAAVDGCRLVCTFIDGRMRARSRGRRRPAAALFSLRAGCQAHRFVCRLTRTLLRLSWSSQRFVEIGRVCVITYGPDAGKLATIVNVLDNNRALVDGPEPLTGVHRHAINLKRVQLTNIKIAAKVDSSQKCVAHRAQRRRCVQRCNGPAVAPASLWAAGSYSRRLVLRAPTIRAVPQQSRPCRSSRGHTAAAAATPQQPRPHCTARSLARSSHRRLVAHAGR